MLHGEERRLCFMVRCFFLNAARPSAVVLEIDRDRANRDVMRKGKTFSII
jgi:hypothetical protein